MTTGKTREPARARGTRRAGRRVRYPSDLTDAQWQVIAAHLPAERPGRRGRPRIWPATGRLVGVLRTASQSAWVDGVAFSPDSKLLASAERDGTVRLWNPASGQPVGPPLRAASRSAGYGR